MHRLSLVAVSRGFLLQWLLLFRSASSGRTGLVVAACRLSVVASGSRAGAHSWHMGFPTACGIFQTRDRAHVPCIGREVLNFTFLIVFFVGQFCKNLRILNLELVCLETVVSDNISSLMIKQLRRTLGAWRATAREVEDLDMTE